MDSPRLNFYKGMLALLLLLQTAGGAMAQNRSHNKSHDRHQNIAHNKPGTGAPLSDKLMGSIELISGLGLGHFPNEADDANPKIHLLEQVNLTLSRSTPKFSFNTLAQGFFKRMRPTPSALR